eukprot:487210_1
MFILDNLDCNPLNAYLHLNGAENVSLDQSAMNLFGGALPCANVTYHFTEMQTVPCEIRYYFTEAPIILKYLYDFISCFYPIWISEFIGYDCYGSSAPTTDPTKDPTSDPTSDPTANPTLSPINTPNCSYDSHFGLDVAFLVDNSCGLDSNECAQQQEGIAELLSSIKLFNNPRFMYIKFGTYTNLTVSLNNNLYNSLATGGGNTAQDNFISLYNKIRNDDCGQKSSTNLDAA